MQVAVPHEGQQNHGGRGGVRPAALQANPYGGQIGGVRPLWGAEQIGGGETLQGVRAKLEVRPLQGVQQVWGRHQSLLNHPISCGVSPTP